MEKTAAESETKGQNTRNTEKQSQQQVPTFTTGPYRQKCRVKYWSDTFEESPSNHTQFVGMLFPKPS